MENTLRIAESKNAQGNELFKLGKYSNALHMYDSAIKLCPKTAKYYGNKSACFIMMQQYLKAQTAAQTAVDIDAKYLKGYERIIKCCLHIGNLNYAYSTVLNAQTLFPEDDIIINLFNTVTSMKENFKSYENYYERKKFSDALNSIENCLKEEPHCEIFMLAKGNCLIYLKRFEEAEKIADDVLKNNKHNEDANFIKTCAQCYQQDVASALFLIKALKLKLPDHSKVNQLYKNTILISENIKNIENAIQNYCYKEAYDLINKTIKIDQYYLVTNKRLRLRKIDAAQGDKQLYWKGISDCDEFMNIYDENLDILHIKVKLLMDLEEYEDATEVYTKILNIDNNTMNAENVNKAKDLFEQQINDDLKILRLSPGSISKETINNAALELKRRYHLDNNHRATSERKRQLEEKFHCVTNAQRRLFQIYQ